MWNIPTDLSRNIGIFSSEDKKMKVSFFAASPKYYFHPLDPESDCDISGKVMAVSANKEI